uniref:ASCH domain-containing protein n=1 Tax=Chlamydomonas leiostraca TaxID=1034604 RepID=A0A7S0RNJ1_9CHLO|mmetsp:Transcript_27215/g.69301  ORF Transcript_27215/g.69301 Transcript_27215/m.69301 type:complete len:126 (+) Transcript_27215:96-473(+)
MAEILQDTQPLCITIQKKYLDLIISGAKTVEGRTNTPKYRALVPGSLVRLTDGQDEGHTATVRVESLATYASFEDMLRAEGLHSCLPGVATLEEGVTIYRSFPGYSELEQAHGVVAIRVKMVGSS